MLRKALALKIFKGFSVKRWNDVLTPLELVEMDKAAEKMVISYLFGKFEEHRGCSVDWRKVIYAGFFDLLRKIVLSDIKAPVLKMIQKTDPDEYRKLNRWVVAQYDGVVTDSELRASFESYLLEDADCDDVSIRIIDAAHKFATLREFDLFRHTNPHSNKMRQIERELHEDVQRHMELEGFRLLMVHQPPFDFLEIVEELRYQVRWGQSQRTPQTTVLGHSFFVACMTLLLLRECGAGERRLFNGFFSALFHDLPEAVTRDIISPVKKATEHLPDVVKTVEEKFVRREIVPRMEPWFRDELLCFTENEFADRLHNSDGTVTMLEKDEAEHALADDSSNPVDGRLVKVADKIAAFLEADRSIEHGIVSEDIKEGRDAIYDEFRDVEPVNGVDVRAFFLEFGRR